MKARTFEIALPCPQTTQMQTRRHDDHTYSPCSFLTVHRRCSTPLSGNYKTVTNVLYLPLFLRRLLVYSSHHKSMPQDPSNASLHHVIFLTPMSRFTSGMSDVASITGAP